MTTRKRILIADNRPDHLKLRQQLFERGHWHVLTADSVAGAVTSLKEKWVHLALIDLRLTNDEDPRDMTGLRVARETDPVVPKIIMTSWPSYEAARDALGLDDEGISPAEGFVDKGRGFYHLLAEAEKVFAHKVRINLELRIEPAATGSLVHLIRQIKPYRRLTDAEIAARAAEIEERAAELEDLLRKLFFDADSLRLTELIPGAGGSGVIQVQPVKHGAEGEFVVVKFGQRSRMRYEWQRFEHYVQEHTGTCTTAMLGKPEETLHYGAARFSLVGKSKGGQPRLFDAFYASQPLDAVTAALTTLFETTCARWYLTRRRWDDPEIDAQPETFEVLYDDNQPDALAGNGRMTAPVNLRRRPDPLACAMERQKALDGEDLAVIKTAWLERMNGRDGLRVSRAAVTGGKTYYAVTVPDMIRALPWLPDPLEFIASQRNRFPLPSIWAITHGDLHAGNILVDDEHRVWLIDFFKTGWGPGLRDFAQLEAAVRVAMVATDHLAALAEFEMACMQPLRLDEPVMFDNRFGHPDLHKALQVTVHIRRLANRITEVSDMREYYVCMLYHTLRLVTWQGSQRLSGSLAARQSHALVSAGLICHRLETWPEQ
jgi:CheY-like chemotaxis protein